MARRAPPRALALLLLAFLVATCFARRVDARDLNVSSAAPSTPTAFLRDLDGDYEITRVTRRPRHASSAPTPARYPARLALALDAFGTRYELDLRRHDALFHRDYRTWSVGADSSFAKREGSHPNRNHCHYRGVVSNAVGESTVAMSLCKGVTAKIITQRERISLEPASAHLPGYESEWRPPSGDADGDAEDADAFRHPDPLGRVPSHQSRRSPHDRVGVVNAVP